MGYVFATIKLAKREKQFFRTEYIRAIPMKNTEYNKLCKIGPPDYERNGYMIFLNDSTPERPYNMNNCHFLGDKEFEIYYHPADKKIISKASTLRVKRLHDEYLLPRSS